MDDPDIGVALSITSLVMTLAQDNLDHYKGAYAKAAARLKRVVVDGEYTQDYLYYKVPCPWLQIKLLRLLQYFPPSGVYSRINTTYLVSGEAVANNGACRGHSYPYHDSGFPSKGS